MIIYNLRVAQCRTNILYSREFVYIIIPTLVNGKYFLIYSFIAHNQKTALKTKTRNYPPIIIPLPSPFDIIIISIYHII